MECNFAIVAPPYWLSEKSLQKMELMIKYLVMEKYYQDKKCRLEDYLAEMASHEIKDGEYDEYFAQQDGWKTNSRFNGLRDRLLKRLVDEFPLRLSLLVADPAEFSIPDDWDTVNPAYFVLYQKDNIEILPAGEDGTQNIVQVGKSLTGVCAELYYEAVGFNDDLESYSRWQSRQYINNAENNAEAFGEIINNIFSCEELL